MISRLLPSITCLLFTFLCITEVVIAQAEGAEVPPEGRLIKMLPMFIIVFFIFYFLVIRPQHKEDQKRQRDKEELMGSLKKGDQLVTSGGLLGKFNAIEGDFVVLEVGSGTKLKVETAHITRRLERKSGDGKGKKKS